MAGVERAPIVLKGRGARLESLHQRFYDIMPAAVNIAVILFFVV